MEWWYDLKLWAGSCSADAEVERIKNAVQWGEWAIEIAENSARFQSRGQGVYDKLGTAKTALGKIGQTLGTVDTVCKDVEALRKIHAAVNELSDESLIERDPQRAARAFGSLFAGFGTLANHLPEPAKSYAQILEGCGDFFANVVGGLHRNLNRGMSIVEQEERLRGARR
jgi:hypothetical protein